MEWARRGFILGLGVGLIVASLLVGASRRPPSDREIKLLAERLGMVMRDEIAPPGQPKEHLVERVVERVVLTVPSGTDWSEVARALEKAGLITDRATFLGKIKERKVDSGLQAGVYVFEPGVALDEIVDRLAGTGQ